MTRFRLVSVEEQNAKWYFEALITLGFTGEKVDAVERGFPDRRQREYYIEVETMADLLRLLKAIDQDAAIVSVSPGVLQSEESTPQIKIYDGWNE